MQTYCRDVQRGRRPAGELEKLAVERHQRDLKAAKRRGYWFDEREAASAVMFFALLKHSKGEWAGQRFDLAPWQVFLVWVLFGWKRIADGCRRFRSAYVEVARKNGKSTLAAGIGLFLFAGDLEPGAEVYTAATKRAQAGIIHGEAVRMVSRSPSLKRQIQTVKNNLSCAATESKYEPLGRDSHTEDGLNVHGALLDELHAHPDRGMYDVLDSATGARRQPLILSITTAGFDPGPDSIAWELHEYTARILRGQLRDDTWFGVIYSLDEGDDWQDERTWPKANPNLGVSVRLDDLRAMVAKAKASPAAQNNVKTKRLNIWTASKTRWLDQSVWDACAAEPEPDDGRAWYAGLDLSSTDDLTAFVRVCRRPDPDAEPEIDPDAGDDDAGEEQQTGEIQASLSDLWDVHATLWVPEDTIHRLEIEGRPSYRQWERAGLLHPVPGPVIDPAHVRADILRDCEHLDLREIAYDPWEAQETAIRLEEDHGLTMVQCRQGFRSMSGPMKHTEKLLRLARVRHGNHPVLSWMFNNVEVKSDPAGNIKPIKPEHGSSQKIDGIVALIMAVSRAMLQPPEGYYNEGLMTL